MKESLKNTGSKTALKSPEKVLVDILPISGISVVNDDGSKEQDKDKQYVEQFVKNNIDIIKLTIKNIEEKTFDKSKINEVIRLFNFFQDEIFCHALISFPQLGK